jgi:hypothetical protein
MDSAADHPCDDHPDNRAGISAAVILGAVFPDA